MLVRLVKHGRTARRRTEQHGYHRAARAPWRPGLYAPGFAHSHGSAAQQPAQSRWSVQRQRGSLRVWLSGEEQPELPIRTDRQARLTLGPSQRRRDLFHHDQADLVQGPKIFPVPTVSRGPGPGLWQGGNQKQTQFKNGLKLLLNDEDVHLVVDGLAPLARTQHHLMGLFTHLDI